MRLRPPPRSPTFREISRQLANSPRIGGAERECSVSAMAHAKLVRHFSAFVSGREIPFPGNGDCCGQRLVRM